MNNAAIDEGVSQIVKIDIPAAWADATDAPEAFRKHVPKFFRETADP
jgi:pyruvate-ferredoxin/flavodoxin oxidoreductase